MQPLLILNFDWFWVCVGGGEKCIPYFDQKPERNRPLERSSHKWGVILEWILEREDGKVMDWIHLAQDRDQLCALVNMVMNLGTE